jgi:O-antigen ligase
MIWNFAVERGMEHPLLGWGFDTSRIMPGGNESLQYRRPLLPLHPHNMVLQLFLELGWAGIISFAVAWAILTRKICNLVDVSEKPVLWAAMTAWLAIAVTGYGMWQYWWLAISWWLAAIMGHMLRGSAK